MSNATRTLATGPASSNTTHVSPIIILITVFMIVFMIVFVIVFMIVFMNVFMIVFMIVIPFKYLN